MLGSIYNNEGLRLKSELKATYNVFNKNKEPSKKYNLFSKLATLYLGNNDVREYGKTVAIYQYLHKLIKQYPAIVNEEINYEALDKNIALIIEKFVGKVTQRQISTDYGIKNLESVKNYKKRLEAYRKEVVKKLQSIEGYGIKDDLEELDNEGLKKRAEEVERIYGEITNFFIGEQGLIRQLLVECIEELGGVPKVTKGGVVRHCEYVVFGMGSMSLGTMTPWSDIEFGILIEEGLADDEKRVKDFFQNVTLLLNIKIINFGESALHYQGIKELNDFTTDDREDIENWFLDDLPPKGFCFDAMLPDGCKTPLGRQGCKGYEDYELIRTPTEMLQFQQEGKWREKDMPLVQSLWHTVLIIGSASLLRRYRGAMDQEFISSHSFRILKEDSEKIDPFKQISDKEKEGQILDVKREIYRFPDRVIVALADSLEKGREENLTAWEAVRRLRTQYGADSAVNLQVALGIATEIRLKTYADHNSRVDNMSALVRYEPHLEELKKEELLAQIFYLKDARILYKYYHIVSELCLKIKSIEDKKSLMKLDRVMISEKQRILIRGYTYRRFLKYYAAIGVFEQLVQNDEQMRNVLAGLYSIVGRNEEALRYCQENLEMDRKKNDHANIATSLNNIGNTYLSLGMYGEALISHQVSLEVKRRICKGDHVDIANFLNNIGNTLECLGRYEEALRYEQEGLEMKRRIYKNNYTDIALLNSLGIILEKLGRYEEALRYYQESLETGCRIYKGDHSYIACSLGNIGNAFRSLGKFEEALRYHKENLEMNQRVFEGDHSFIASSLNNIGNTFHCLGKYEEALQYHQKSLEMYRRIHKEDHADIASSLSNVGSTLRSLSRYKEALGYYRESLEMRRRIYKGDHVDIASSLNNIGGVLDEVGRYTKALKYKQKSLKMYCEIHKEDHADVASALNNIGASLRNLGKYDKALEYHRKSLDMKLKIYKGDHADIAMSLNDIGVTYQNLGKYYEALRYHHDALNMRLRTYKGDHIDIAVSLNNIGTIFQHLGQYNEAVSCHERSLDMMNAAYKGDHAYTAGSLNNIANILRRLGKYDEALRYHQESLEMRHRIHKGNHANIAVSLSYIAEILNELGRYEEAYDHAVQAKNMFGNLLLAEHLDTKNANIQFIKATVGLANQQILSDNPQKGLGYYIKIFPGMPNLLAIVRLCADQWYKIGDLNLTISCFEVLSEKLLPNDRSIKHNLANCYHIKALKEKANRHRDKYLEYLSKARTTFEAAISLDIEENPKVSTYVEYVMFLLKYHNLKDIEEYEKIKGLLHKAIGLGDDKSNLSYKKIEQGTIAEALQNLFNKQEEGKINSYYIHKEREEAQHELEVLITIVSMLKDNDKVMTEYLINCLSKECDLHHIPNGYEPNAIENQYVPNLLGLITNLPFRAYLRNDKSYIVDAIYQRQDIEKPEYYVQIIRAQYNLPFVLKNSEKGYQIILNGVNISQVSNLIMERFKSNKHEGSKIIN